MGLQSKTGAFFLNPTALCRVRSECKFHMIMYVFSLISFPVFNAIVQLCLKHAYSVLFHHVGGTHNRHGKRFVKGCQSGYLPASQSGCQSISQSFSQSVSQSFKQIETVSKSVSQSASQSACQLIIQIITQLVCWSASQSVSQSVSYWVIQSLGQSFKQFVSH